MKTVDNDAAFVEERYSELEVDRVQFLDRARECAALTVPTMLAPDGHSSGQAFPTPYQSMGARTVGNLGAKLLQALLPSNSPFFRMVPSQKVLDEFSQDPKAASAFQEAFSKYESTVMQAIETSADRVGIAEALKHLIVTGNALLYRSDDGLRVYHLDSYVIRRDPSGNPLEIITVETVAKEIIKDLLPSGVVCDGDRKSSEHNYSDLYTYASLEDGKWTVYQESEGHKLLGTEGTFTKDKFPFIPLRWFKVSGESYGRGLVEEYLGDLQSLEVLTKAIVDASLAASKILFLVDPNGTTRANSLANAPSGSIRNGRASDVSTLQLNKQADLTITMKAAESIERRLSEAFLLSSGVQRNAERVTAEEIRWLAGELESSLGGVYSTLSAEFQLPYVRLVIAALEETKQLNKLPKDAVRPMIVTGLDALGRGNDLNKLDMLVKGLGEILGPDAVARYVDVSEYITRRAAAVGIDPKGLIKSPEMLAQEQQQAQAMQAMQALGPEAMKGLQNVDPNMLQGMMQQASQQQQGVQ